jgi:TonB-linked SusC/RagA family outer membrane protein
MKNKLFLLLCALLMAVVVSAQTRMVQGTVVQAGDHEPIIGATVVAVGTTIGTVTDIDGKFRLQVPQNVHKIKVSYVGFETQEVSAHGSNLLIKLVSSSQALDEVMVVAYGTSKKSAFTGSASVVSADELSDRLVTDVATALAGSVSGVQLQSTTGQPGTEPTVIIRGVGSINASSNPLYVVDGVPYDGGLSSINPSDVESITVLKDAASAALYGARGANGVILVTTKKGRSGEAKITVDARWGSNSRQIKNYDIISDPWSHVMQNYIALKNYYTYTKNLSAESAHLNAVSQLNAAPSNNLFGYQMFTIPSGESLINADGTFNPNATLGYSDGTNYFLPDNWEDGSYTNGFRQEYNLSINGGTDQFKYMLSGSYLTDEGIIQASDYDRLTTRATVDYQAKKWLKVGTNLAYTYESMNKPQSQQTTGQSSNVSYMANFIAPIYPMYIRDAEGNIMHDETTGYRLYDYGMLGLGLPYSRKFLSGGNPIGALHYDKSEYLYDVFNGKWYAQLTPVEGLTVTGTVGYYLNNMRFNYLTNRKYGQMANYGGSIEQDMQRTRSINYQALANYVRTFGENNHWDFLLGYESYDLNIAAIGGEGQNIYSNDNYTLSNVIDKKNHWGSSESYATRGYFARVNYNYDGKYYVSASYRRDASSRFHPDNRWGNFWSFSAAWDLKKELFMANAEAIDMLKFKASFGQQGNDNLSTSTSNNYYAWADQYNQSGANSVWTVGTLYYKGNPDITWETSNSFNTGFDFSFLRGKVNGTIEYFLRQTDDMLYYKPTGPSLGYSSIPMNIGSMRNSGMEFEVTYRALDTKKVTWDINANVTYVKNKVISLAPELNGTWISGNRIYEEGESMYRLYLVKYAGVDPETGDALYWAKDKDGVEYKTSDYNTAYSGNSATGDQANRQATANTLPPIYGGFGTTLNAFGFDFSILFGYQLGGKIMDYGYQLLMSGGYSSSIGTALHKDTYNAWTEDNPYTDVPRLDYGGNKYASSTSDRWLISSNYLSLNNITFGYTFPSSMSKKLGLESIRLYGAADNVALWSKRKGMDPRQSYVQSKAGYYSSLRSVSGGVKFVF